jgi:hypothetical protein
VYPLQQAALPCRIVVIEASPTIRLASDSPRPFGFDMVWIVEQVVVRSTLPCALQLVLVKQKSH